MKTLTRMLVLPALLALTGATPDMVAAQGQNQAQDPILMYKEAGADKQQQQKIRAYADEYERTAKLKAEEANALIKKMRELSLQAMPDEQECYTTQERLNDLQQEISLQRIKLMINIRKVLTPAQRTRLVNMIKERAAQMRPPQMAP